jgi:transposase-like protein
MPQKQNDAMNQAIDLLINSDTDISTIFKEDGLLKQLTKRIVEKALQSEMNHHLGYNKYSQSDIDNARNGYNIKNLITKDGTVEIEVPRDRNSSFAPSLVAKRQRRLDGFDDKVLSLYAKGMSLSDIKLQLQELYGADVSESLISGITDDIIEDVKLWQSRPLDPVYAIVFFDCLVVKVRQDKRIINK